MKNSKMIGLLAGAIIIASIVIIACSKTRSVVPNTVNSIKTQEKVTAPNELLQICNCATSVPGGICPQFKSCASSILGGSNLSRNFTIDWTSCAGCGQGTIPPPSTGRICYTENCGELNVQFSNLPECMWPCFGELTNCFVFKSIVCNNGQFSMQYTGDNGNQAITITGDPDITMDCTKNGVTKTCVGKLNWTI